MDIFYQTCPTTFKRRVHFHEFMLDVHARLHTQSKSLHRGDSIRKIAQSLFQEAWLLCFDEFQVTDIPNAMILRSLLNELFELGTVIVTTSNRSPDDLYKDGLNRSLFLPCIHQLKERCLVHSLESGIDYRQISKLFLSFPSYPLFHEPADTIPHPSSSVPSFPFSVSLIRRISFS